MHKGPRIYNVFPLLLGPVSRWTDQLERAAAMGFNWVYVNPFHLPGFSGSLYAIKDYYRLHPAFREREEEDSLAAVRPFIRRAAESIPGVQEGEAMIKQPGKNRLAVIASVVLSGPKPVVEVTREIQNRIRHEVEQRLGLPKGTEIKVHVRRVIPDSDEFEEPAPFPPTPPADESSENVDRET